jgi:hypothetical protein
MYSTYVKTQPWIVMNFPEDDNRADANSLVIFQCAICGDRTEQRFSLPGADDPIWQNLDSEKGIPEAYALRVAYQTEHLHADKSGDVWSWSMPLLNPAAHPGGVNTVKLAERLKKELDKKP